MRGLSCFRYPVVSMTTQPLNEAVEHHGYGIAEAVLDELECVQLLDHVAASAVGRSRAGARHLLCSPPVASLASDPRLSRIAASVLRRPAIPFRATLFNKSNTANWSVAWHQDTALPLRTRFEAPGWGPWSVKAGVLYAHAPTGALERVIALRVHLDDSVHTNGPLRVLPGTHLLGVLSDEEIAHVAQIAHAADCVVARGGVLAMRPLLIHSSPRVEVTASRRVLHIEYVDSLTFGPKIELATA